MKKVLLAIAFTSLAIAASAQEEELTPMEKLEQRVEVLTDKTDKLSALKVTGYFQPQWQFGDQAAALRIGTANTGKDAYNRFGVRRGRIKFTYDDGGIASGVFQLNITDKEGLKGATVQLKEAYLNIKDPIFKTNALRMGVFDRPFGNEISYSSATLESPERSRIINALFPEECDMGTMLVLQPAGSSPLNFIKFEGGLFAGNAINPETDNRKDFIGHIVATRPIGNTAKWGVGVSYYNGGVYQTDSTIYTMDAATSKFVKDKNAANIGAYSKREYFGADAQFSFESPLGMTQLRGEYIFGTQPGNKASSASPNRNALPAAEAAYIRPFSGFYGILVQDLGELPFSAVVKYDVYDPNTAVAGNLVGAAGSGTTSTDIKYTTLGVGGLWRVNPNVRLQVYYDFVTNETSSALANANILKDFSKDLKDNMLTVRLQYKF